MIDLASVSDPLAGGMVIGLAGDRPARDMVIRIERADDGNQILNEFDVMNKGEIRRN